MSVEFDEAEWDMYDLAADDLAAAAEAVASMDEAARAEWAPRFEFTTLGGLVVSAAVTVTTRVTMPHWSGFGKAHPIEQAEWTRFCTALREHEQGHLDLVVRHLSTIDRVLVGKSVAAAQRSWEQALRKLASASQAYDRATDHGRKHGTIINADVSMV